MSASTSASITRRHVLSGLTAALALPAVIRRAGAAALPELVLHGPPAGPSIVLAHAIATGALSDIAGKSSFRAWRNPDEMRAGLTSGTMQAVVMPTNTAANLYNRGLGIHLVNVMTNGLLYVVSTDPGLRDFQALRGRKIALPFRNDTPEFVFNRLLRHHGLEAGRDLAVDTTGTPIEAVQLLLAGRIDAAVVPEPAPSAAMLRAMITGKTVHRVIDIQAEWRSLAGPDATLPQAGLAVTRRFLEANRDAVAALNRALAGATREVLAAPARAASDAAVALELPGLVLERSIPYSNLVAIPAAEAKRQLESMFQVITDADPAITGGKLPDAGFYLS